jgi:hypothetical protein
MWLYSRGVNEAFFAELSAWLAQAGLAGTSETDIVSGFCDRCVAAGLPLARALMFVDTLHLVFDSKLIPTKDLIGLMAFGVTHLWKLKSYATSLEPFGFT